MKPGLLNLFSALSMPLLIAAAQSNAQTPQRDTRPRTASIGGRVTVGGAPAANALVMVTEVDPPSGGASPGGESRQRAFIKVRTDSDGRYRITANLPDGGWRIRAITQSVAGAGKQSSGATKKNVDISRDGVAIKPGEKLSGVEVTVAEDAATLDGRIAPAKDGMNLPSSLRAHLIPAEATSADDVIRYAETDVRGDGSFEFKHVAPGKYLLHARQVAEKEASDDQARPAAWDAAERAKLRREAMAAKNEIELQPCGRVKDYVLRFAR